jgi:hypothetical protein
MGWIRALGLVHLMIITPAFGRDPVKATLVISRTPEPFYADLGEPGRNPAPVQAWGEEADCGGDFTRIEPADIPMHHPFQLKLENFKVERAFLESHFFDMDFQAPVELSLAWQDAQHRVHRFPVSFGSALKDANFLKVLIKHDALKAQQAYRQKSLLGRMAWYWSSLAESTEDDLRFAMRQLNCLTFNHFVHHNESMGFFPVLEAAQWQPIPFASQRFGDMVAMRNDNLVEGQHFLMSLGGGWFLSKLGNTEDLVVTDLDNGIGLYRVSSADPIAIGAFRAR